MSDDSEQVTALIRELLILNREESTPIEFSSEKEIEGRKAQRRRIRQKLVEVLHLRDRKRY
jgi:hypothetical protein